MNERATCGIGLATIRSERIRQIEQEGWTADHDDGHDRGDRIYRAPLPKDQRPEARRQWHVHWYQHRRQSFLDQGLTTHGKPRLRRLSRLPTARERSWREFRASLNLPTPDFLTPAERVDL